MDPPDPNANGLSHRSSLDVHGTMNLEADLSTGLTSSADTAALLDSSVAPSDVYSDVVSISDSAQQPAKNDEQKFDLTRLPWELVLMVAKHLLCPAPHTIRFVGGGDRYMSPSLNAGILQVLNLGEAGKRMLYANDFEFDGPRSMMSFLERISGAGIAAYPHEKPRAIKYVQNVRLFDGAILRGRTPEPEMTPFLMKHALLPLLQCNNLQSIIIDCSIFPLQSKKNRHKTALDVAQESFLVGMWNKIERSEGGWKTSVDKLTTLLKTFTFYGQPYEKSTRRYRTEKMNSQFEYEVWDNFVAKVVSTIGKHTSKGVKKDLEDARQSKKFEVERVSENAVNCNRDEAPNVYFPSFRALRIDPRTENYPVPSQELLSQSKNACTVATRLLAPPAPATGSLGSPGSSAAAAFPQHRFPSVLGANTEATSMPVNRDNQLAVLHNGAVDLPLVRRFGDELLSDAVIRYMLHEVGPMPKLIPTDRPTSRWMNAATHQPTPASIDASHFNYRARYLWFSSLVPAFSELHGAQQLQLWYSIRSNQGLVYCTEIHDLPIFGSGDDAAPYSPICYIHNWQHGPGTPICSHGVCGRYNWPRATYMANPNGAIFDLGFLNHWAHLSRDANGRTDPYGYVYDLVD